MKKMNSRIDPTDKVLNDPAQSRAPHQAQVFPPPPYSNTVLPPSSSSTHWQPGPSIDSHSGDSLTEDARCCIGNELTSRCRCQVISIDALPDEVLLEIFDFYVVTQGPFWPGKKGREAWQLLVHVCRRWRSIVFGSSRRLNLRLVCSSRTPVRDTIDIWPELPLQIEVDWWFSLPMEDSPSPLSDGVENLRGGDGGDVLPSQVADDGDQKEMDNIIAALERRDRVDDIGLLFRDDASTMEKVFAAMQEPFPELINLQIHARSGGVEIVTVLPDSFLGGSAPRLQNLMLIGIPFPGIPKLLLSATHLVDIDLQDIPNSGYFSPEAMVTALSTLTSLRRLFLRFLLSPQSRPDRGSRHPPPLTRSVLPVITTLVLHGVIEYINDFVARIDTPRIYELVLVFFNQILFDTPQVIQFISRTPTLEVPEKARVSFLGDTPIVCLTSCSGIIRVGVRCLELDWQISSMEQVCVWCLPSFSTLEDLYVEAMDWESDRQDNIENALWLELLQPFAVVKNLYLSEQVTPHIVPALQELVGGRATEVLPALQNIFLQGLEVSGPVQKGIEKFVTARQDSVVVSRWESDRKDEEIEADEEIEEDEMDTSSH